METGKNCRMVWSGDTGFGGIFVKVPYCENTYTPNASGYTPPAKRAPATKAKENPRDWSFHFAGFRTFVLASIWRYWSR